MNLKIVETCPSKCMFQRGISDINYIYNIMDWGHTCNVPVEWLVPAHCSLGVCPERADLGLGWAVLGWAELGWAGSLPLNQLLRCAASSRTTVTQGNQRQLGQKLGCLGLAWPGTWQSHTGMTHGACSHVQTLWMQMIDLSKISVYTFILWTWRHTYNIQAVNFSKSLIWTVVWRYFIGTAADSDIGSNIYILHLLLCDAK